jgi:lysophospholipase L1-like esterase
VRHLIQQQMNGDESELAATKSPLLLWGPYLWAEGEKGRKLDDLKYVKDDFADDGTHPSRSGREKVAKQLLEFFATSPLAKGWFAK